MNLSHKALPPRWKYLIPLQHVKALVRDSVADIRSVEFEGTANKPTDPMPYYWHAAMFESRVVTDTLCFQLIFSGIPEHVIALANDDLAQQTADAIESFLNQQHNVTDATTPTRIGFVTLDASSEEIVFNYSCKNTSSKQLPAIPWW